MQMLKLTKSKIKVSIHSCPLLTKNIEKMAVLIFIFSSSCLNNNKKKDTQCFLAPRIVRYSHFKILYIHTKIKYFTGRADFYIASSPVP